MHKNRVLAAAVIAVAALLPAPMVSSVAHAATPVTTLVKSGDVAPGTGGAVFSFFSEAYIGVGGNVAFSGYLEPNAAAGIDFNNREGVWTYANGIIQQYAREGTPVSGKPATSFTSMVGSGPSGAAHQTVLKAYSTEGRGLFGGTAGNVQPIALTGMQAAGMEPGVTYGNNVMGVNINGVPRGNASGQTVFTSDTVGGPAGTNAGLWRGTAGNLDLVARYGFQAPGLEAGATIIHLSEGSINDNGHVAFSAQLGGTASADNAGVVYAGAPGALSVVTRTGNPAPGLPGVQIVAPPFGGFGPNVAINNAGQVAFAASLGGAGVTTDNDAAIFAGAAGSLGVVARKGDAAAPSLPGVTLQYLDDPFLAGNGHAMFMSALTGAGIDTNNDSALFTSVLGGDKKLIIREGDVIPGATDGAQLRFFDFLGVNALGQTHFTAGLKGAGVNFDNDYALFASDPSGNLVTVIRTGEQLDLGGGDLRTVIDLYIPSYSGGQDGLGTALNDSGKLVFSAVFEDGSEGIFSVNAPVPEPSSALALLAAAALGLRRQRRRGRFVPPFPVRRG